MKRMNKIGLRQERSNSHSAQNKKGFSLVELMVGSTALALVLAGSFSGLGQAMLIEENVHSSNFASQLLQSEMDEIHLMNWTEVSNLSGKGTFNPEKTFSSIPLRSPSYTRIVSSLGSSQKQIRLQVAWTDLRGKSHSQDYVTFYTKDGLFDYSYRAL